MIKAVVFDLDHTLFDRHGTLRAIVPALRDAFDVDPEMTDEKIASLWCCADDRLVYHGWEKIWRFLADNGVFRVVPEFEAYRDFLIRQFGCTAVPFPDTLPMLAKLRVTGYKTAIITNGYHELQNKKIDMLGFRGLFKEIMVSGDYEADKPDRRIFDIMREKLELLPQEIVYVGDNPINDIKGAAEAGWKTVWMKSTGYWDMSVPRADAEVSSVSEVPDAILQLQYTEE